MTCKHLDGIFDEEQGKWVCKYCGAELNDVEDCGEAVTTIDLRGEKVVVGAKINDRDFSRAITFVNVRDGSTVTIVLDARQLYDLARVLSELVE